MYPAARPVAPPPSSRHPPASTATTSAAVTHPATAAAHSFAAHHHPLQQQQQLHHHVAGPVPHSASMPVAAAAPLAVAAPSGVGAAAAAPVTLSTPVKAVHLSCIFAWHPKSSHYVATVSMSGDDDFSQDSYLQLHHVELKEDQQQITNSTSNLMPTVLRCKLPERAQSMAWSSHSAGPGQQLGIIACGLSDGQILLYSVDSLFRHAPKQQQQQRSAGGQQQQQQTPTVPDEAALVGKITHHHSAVRACTFNPIQPNILATGGADKELCVWNVQDPAKPTPIPVCTRGTVHPAEITDIRWNPHVFNILVTACHNGVSTVWDLRSKKVTAQFNVNITTPQQSAAATALAWHPTSAIHLAVARDEPLPVVQLWDVKKAMQQPSLLPLREFGSTYHTGGILSLAWCPTDATLLATCSRDGQTLFFNPENGERVGSIGVPSPSKLSWIPDVSAVISVASFDSLFGLYSTLAVGQGASAPKFLSARPCPAVFGYGGKIALPAQHDAAFDAAAYEKENNNDNNQDGDATSALTLPPKTQIPIIAAPPSSSSSAQQGQQQQQQHSAAASGEGTTTVSDRERLFQQYLAAYPVRSEEWLQWIKGALGEIAPAVVVSAESVTEETRQPLLRYLDVSGEAASHAAASAVAAYEGAGGAFDAATAVAGHEEEEDEEDQGGDDERENDQADGDAAVGESSPFDDAPVDNTFGGGGGSGSQRHQEPQVTKEQRKQQRLEAQQRRRDEAAARAAAVGPPPTTEQYEDLLASCVVSGALSDAVDLAIRAGNYDDAFGIALVADAEQVRKVHEAFAARSQNRARRVPQYLRAIAQRQWTEVAQSAALACAQAGGSDAPWRQAMGLFATYADADGFSAATLALASALEHYELIDDAASVAALGGHVDKALALFSNSLSAGSVSQRNSNEAHKKRTVDTTTLVQLGTIVEYINSLGATAEAGAYARVLLDHAKTLAAEGDFELALYHASRAGQLGLGEATVVADRLRYLVQPSQAVQVLPIGPSRLLHAQELPDCPDHLLADIYAEQQAQAAAEQQRLYEEQQRLYEQQQREQAAAAAIAAEQARIAAEAERQRQLQYQREREAQERAAAAAQARAAAEAEAARKQQALALAQQQAAAQQQQQAAAQQQQLAAQQQHAAALEAQRRAAAVTSHQHHHHHHHHHVAAATVQQQHHHYVDPRAANIAPQHMHHHHHHATAVAPMGGASAVLGARAAQSRAAAEAVRAGAPAPAGPLPRPALGAQASAATMGAGHHTTNGGPPMAAPPAPAAQQQQLNTAHLPPAAQNFVGRMQQVAAGMTDARKKDAVDKAVAAFAAKAGSGAGLSQNTLRVLCGWADSLGNPAAAKAEWTKVVDGAWAEVQQFSNVKFAM